ncbi:protein DETOXIFICATION 45, chloroplastic isoform X2 [Impatiens glandulifera]|uniref:protein DETOXIFICATION 45, chloroplastic isoform X2 n=1 Tax=Impatiens glandulifera TaxID=253017 RepID=UPI001FB07EB1|nr:protein DETOXIFICATION 45, chloroplastic isoform X2 [Impatiens glandulifera]
MTTSKLTYGMVSTGLPSRLTSEYDLTIKSKSLPFNLKLPCGNNICLANSYKKKTKKKRFTNGDVLPRSSLFSTFQKKPTSPAFGNRFIFNCGSNPSFVDESSTAKQEQYLSNSSEKAFDLEDKFSTQLQIPDAKREVIMLSWPAFAGQAIEPFAQLMETAYIGRIGSVELASAGISISIFNIISKLFNIPLLSIATSFVAEDISKNEVRHFNSDVHDEEGSISKAHKDINKKKHLSSVSTALVLAVGIGIIEALALCIGSGLFLNLMGISKGSPMRFPAQKFLCLRALGAPAVVISLALQGIFRGFKDTRTPVLCLCIGNFSAIFLLPLLMYYLQLGVTGAAISTVISQYIVTLLMIWHLNKRVVLLPPKLRDLRFSGYLKSGGFLIGRTLAVLITMTLGTSMAVRQGPVAMAAHQICLQVWLAVSMLTDALAASAQALVASYLSKGDYKTSREVTNFVLKLGLLTGASLAVILGLSFSTLATLFTKDMEVLCAVKTVVLFVSASQPLNALAFIVDGLHFGVSDFKYAAYSMIAVGAISSAYLLCAPPVFGFRGVWSGLALFMGLRAVAGCIRLLSKDGPWWFLHVDLKEI